MVDQTDSPPEKRFVVTPAGRTTRKLVGGPSRLNSRMDRMIVLMSAGHEDDPEHTPYDVADAAKAVGYRARAGRALLKSPVFSEALAKARLALLHGHHSAPAAAERLRAAPGYVVGRFVPAPTAEPADQAASAAE